MFNLFKPSVTFHIKPSHIETTPKQMTGFYMKRNTDLKWAKKRQNSYNSRKQSISNMLPIHPM